MNQLETHQKPKLLSRMADKFGIDADKMLSTLKSTAFRGDVSNEQMIALLVVAEQYNLNPWTKEIYAFPDKRNGIIPVVGVDGWSRIINQHGSFDGMEFVESEKTVEGGSHKKCPEWIECKIFRKDRTHPISVRERFDECYQKPFVKDGREIAGPWQTHTSRFLRHKAMIQCARLAFGFVGIYEQDEADRIMESAVEKSVTTDPRGDLSMVPHELTLKHFGAIVDLLNQDKDEYAIATDLREYVAVNLQPFQELQICVQDKLAADKVISKANWAKYLKLYKPEENIESA